MTNFRDFKYPHLILILLLINIALVVWSCSGRDNSKFSNPTVPLDSKDESNLNTNQLPILASSVENNQVKAGTGVLGLFEVHLDPDRESAEVAAIRTGSAIGDPHNVDITSFMQGSLGKNCFSISSVDYSEDEILSVKFRVSHPFDKPVNDPLADSDRLDLHVFDLMAIVIMPDDEEGMTSFPDTLASLFTNGGVSTLSSDNSGFWAFEEWDGYTSDFDTQIDRIFPTEASIHPYKILSYDPSDGNVNAYSQNGFDDIRNPSGHNVFAQGSQFETTFDFNVAPGNSVSFIMALTAAYGQSSKGKGLAAGQRANPRYFLPEFNRKNAWKVNVEIPFETDLLDSNDPLSSTVLVVKVWDWQHSEGYLMDDIDPLTDRLDALRSPGKVAFCTAEIPSVSELDTVTTCISGEGFDSDPLVYQITINNDLDADEGGYFGLVGVIDEMHGQTITGYGVERDGITAFDVSSFTTYAPFTVDVVDREAEGFNLNMSMSNPGGQDNGNSGIAPDTSDGKSIATKGDNVYVVYSAFNAPGGDGWDVYFQRSADRGETWNPSVRVNQSVVEDQISPSILLEPASGELYVAYTDESGLGNDTYQSDVLLINIDENGKVIGTPIILNSSRLGEQFQATMGVGEFGELIVAWQNGGINGGIGYTQSDGISVGRQKLISPARSGTSPLQDPLIIVDGNPQSPFKGTKYLIYRQEELQSPDIMCAVYDELTSQFGEGVSVSNEWNGLAYDHNAAIDKNGRLYVSYIEEKSGIKSMKMARSINEGQYWAHTGAIGKSLDGKDPQSPTLVVRPDNNFIFLFWSDLVEGDRNIYAVRSLDGQHFSRVFLLNRDSGMNDQDFPSVAVNADGDMFVIWRDMRDHVSGEMYFSRGRS
jgi:hypothetical protein